MHHGTNSNPTDRSPCADLLTTAPNLGVPFRRMFPELPAAQHDPTALIALAEKTGDPDSSAALAHVLSGQVFLGQFIDHDITFQANTPDLGTPHPIDGDPPQHDENGVEVPQGTPVTNCRDPLLNLDSVYGAGPGDATSGILYENRYFKLVDNRDIPRDGPQIGQRMIGGQADTRLIADPRNDENILILQVHVLFMRLHNVVLRKLAADPAAPTMAEFDAAKAKIILAYRHIVYFEYLQNLVGDVNLVSWVHTTGHAHRFANMQSGSDIALSIEFAVAAFRFQHSQVRGGYALNRLSDPPNGRALFRPDGGPDMRGNQKIDDSTQMDFALFFAGAKSLTPNNAPSLDEANRALPIDGALSGPLMNLPPSAINGGPASLAERNLLRGRDVGLPSGQAIAEELKAEGQPSARVLEPHEINIDVDRGNGEDLNASTPLWFYVLREAEVINAGAALGPVGSRILAEVFVGLLLRDGLPFPGQASPPELGRSFADLVNLVQENQG